MSRRNRWVWRRMDDYYDNGYGDDYDDDDDHDHDDGFGPDSQDHDSYGESTDDDEDDEGNGGYGSAPHHREDNLSETSSQRLRRRELYTTYDADFGRPRPLHSKNWYLEAFRNYLNMEQIKMALVKAHLPKSGYKEALVERLAEHLDVLYRAKNVDAYNQLVNYINGLPRSYGKWRAQISQGHPILAPYLDEAAILQMNMLSKALDFKWELPPGYKIERALSDPLFLPFVPAEMYDVKLEFQYQLPSVTSTPLVVQNVEKFVALLVVRVYEAPSEATSLDGLRTRFSFGSKLQGLTINQCGGVTRPDCKSKFPFFRPQQYTLKNGLNSLCFIPTTPRLPYYLQVLEISHDQTVKPVISAEKVIRQVLDRAKQSEVIASSIQLSLKCPLTFQRIATPVRFESCKHLQCMELASWLSYSQSDNFYVGKKTCPICNSSGSGTIVIDGFSQEILKGTTEEVEFVTIDVENGCAWSVTALSKSESKESIAEPSSNRNSLDLPSSSQQEEIWIDLTEDTTVYDAPWVQPPRIKKDPGLPPELAKSLKPQTTAIPQVSQPSVREPRFIDLTEDADDQVTLPMRRSPPTARSVEIVEID